MSDNEDQGDRDPKPQEPKPSPVPSPLPVGERDFVTDSDHGPRDHKALIEDRRKRDS